MFTPPTFHRFPSHFVKVPCIITLSLSRRISKSSVGCQPHSQPARDMEPTGENGPQSLPFVFPTLSPHMMVMRWTTWQRAEEGKVGNRHSCQTHHQKPKVKALPSPRVLSPPTPPAPQAHDGASGCIQRHMAGPVRRKGDAREQSQTALPIC